MERMPCHRGLITIVNIHTLHSAQDMSTHSVNRHLLHTYYVPDSVHSSKQHSHILILKRFLMLRAGLPLPYYQSVTSVECYNMVG